MLLVGMGPSEKQQARQYAEWALRLCSNSSGGVATSLADARLDSTQAEATHLLGRVYLESGDLRRACELLLRALYFATQVRLCRLETLAGSLATRVATCLAHTDLLLLSLSLSTLRRSPTSWRPS